MDFLNSEELKKRQKNLKAKMIEQGYEDIQKLSKLVNDDLEKISKFDPDVFFIIYDNNTLKRYSTIIIEEVFIKLRDQANYGVEFTRDNGKIILVRIQW